jgi:hypothetical protein
MLIQISENSAAVTPFGSLAQVYRDAGSASGTDSGAVQALSVPVRGREDHLSSRAATASPHP